MSSEHWREVQRLLDAALDQPPALRSAFLREATVGAPERAMEVARLLESCARVEQRSLFEGGAAEWAAPMLRDLAILDLRRQETVLNTLRGALAGRYELEDAISAGSMGIVFPAHDPQHDRRVAVKVLDRDLVVPSGVDRFLQEIRLTAALSHPHILPVYESGETGGLLYYITPWLTEETLRSRLTRAGALPIPEAVRLIREIADALVHAHGHGVVHRDLKPENVLLAGGHAVIADFGIAKVLAGQSGFSSGEESRISASAGLGTPAYMAPEQVGGGPVDPRADLYALGVIAYELLSGAHPFGNRPVQDMLTAHLTEVPAPLRTVRGDVPPALAELIAQCLAKRPADRPPSAEAVRSALGEAVPRIALRSRRRFALLAAGSGMVLLAVLTALTIGPPSLLKSGNFGARDTILVADFEGLDSSLSRPLASALRQYLGQSRLVHFVDPYESDFAEVLQLMHVSPSTRVTAAVAREFAERANLRAVVQGELTPMGGGYLVNLRLLATANGAELASFSGTAARLETDLLPVLGKLGALLRQRTGEALQTIQRDLPLARYTTSSLEALKMLEGARASPPPPPDERFAYMRQAVRLDSMFAYAWLVLGNSLPLSRAESRDSAFTMAYRFRDRLTVAERAQVTSFYWRFVGLDRVRALQAQEEAFRRLTGSPNSSVARAVALNLADWLIEARQFERAQMVLQRVEPWPVVASIGPSLLEIKARVALGLGQVAAADSLVEKTAGSVRHLRYAGLIALAALRQDTAASLLAMVPSSLESEVREPKTQLKRLSGQLREAERLQSALDSARLRYDRAAGFMVSPGDLPPRLLLVQEDLWLRNDRAGALRRLDDLLLRNPVHSLTGRENRIALVTAARLYAALGRPARARAILGAVLTGSDSLALRRFHPEHQAALGEIALAEGRPREAMERFRRSDLAADGLPTSPCAVCVFPLLARAAEQAGMTDSARVFWERYLHTPSLNRLEADQWFFAMALRRLASLHAAIGEEARAAMYTEQLEQLGRRADPDCGEAFRVEGRPASRGARPRIGPIDREGEVAARVEPPHHSRIAGFGAGSVYVGPQRSE
jgi:serine/threonine protein kinase/tetratricopeptide (TPR) repeat protein